jgi:hypothetical protein
VVTCTQGVTCVCTSLLPLSQLGCLLHTPLPAATASQCAHSPGIACRCHTTSSAMADEPGGMSLEDQKKLVVPFMQARARPACVTPACE